MRKSGSVFLSAVGAGLAISVGGTVYLSLENKIAGALLFTIGLYAIVLNGLYLYTGKVGYLVEQKNKKEYGILLVLTWLGNLVGPVSGRLPCAAPESMVSVIKLMIFVRRSLRIRREVFFCLQFSAEC